jgi:CRISPR-associated protein Cas2
VANAREDFGFRRQLSVFLFRLSATGSVRLRRRLYDAVNLDEDEVLFLPLCGKCCHIEALGRPTDPAESKDVVLVV